MPSSIPTLEPGSGVAPSGASAPHVRLKNPLWIQCLREAWQLLNKPPVRSLALLAPFILIAGCVGDLHDLTGGRDGGGTGGEDLSMTGPSPDLSGMPDTDGGLPQ